jgi:hypothetical protein
MLELTKEHVQQDMDPGELQGCNFRNSLRTLQYSTVQIKL